MRQWIDEIRVGKRPDFSAPSTLFGGPDRRMKMQVLLADFLIETPSEHLEFGTLEEFRKRRAEEVRRAIKGQLDKRGN